jgi:hypothetical protein
MRRSLPQADVATVLATEPLLTDILLAHGTEDGVTQHRHSEVLRTAALDGRELAVKQNLAAGSVQTLE